MLTVCQQYSLHVYSILAYKHSAGQLKSVLSNQFVLLCTLFNLPPDEDFGRGKETTKKIRAPPREIKIKKSKNSQEDRQESVYFQRFNN